MSGVLALAAIVWELIAKEPIVPLRLFSQRTFALTTIASLVVGVTMYGTSVFVSQYFQLARGMTPTESGIMQMPLVAGTLATSIVLGQVVSRTGKWKAAIVTSTIILLAGITLMGTLRYDTSMWLVGLYLGLVGVGSGGMMQNLTLVLQNSLQASRLGAGTAAHTFSRSLIGTIGVTVLGAIVTSRIATELAAGIPELGARLLRSVECAPGVAELRSGTLPNVRELCEPLQILVESTYADGIAAAFMAIVPIGIIAVVAVAFLPNRPLSRKNAMQQIDEERELAVQNGSRDQG